MEPWNTVEELRTIRQESQRHAVRCALKQGARPLRCYRQEGQMVLQVERPAHWPCLAAGDTAVPLTCFIPAARADATLAWLATRQEVQV